MTLISAMRISSGAVLHADSEENYGNFRRSVQKIVPRKMGQLDVIIAGSGIGRLIDGFIAKVNERLDRDRASTIADVKRAILKRGIVRDLQNVGSHQHRQTHNTLLQSLVQLASFVASCEYPAGFSAAIIFPMHKRVNGVLVPQNGGQTHNVLLDLELNPIRVNEKSEPTGWTLVNRPPVPGQLRNIPEGNYTLQPHEHSPQPTQVRIEKIGWTAHMFAGWL